MFVCQELLLDIPGLLPLPPVHLEPVMFADIPHCSPETFLMPLKMIWKIPTMAVEENDCTGIRIFRIMKVPVMPGISAHDRQVILIHRNHIEIPPVK